MNNLYYVKLTHIDKPQLNVQFLQTAESPEKAYDNALKWVSVDYRNEYLECEAKFVCQTEQYVDGFEPV